MKKLLGPDGKRLDVEKYRPVKELPVAKVGEFTFEFTASYDHAITPFKWLTLGTEVADSKPKTKPRQSALRTAVERDIAAIHAALPSEWEGHVESPPPPPELTDTYAVAFGSAQKKCRHESSHSTLHARRERQCDDCGKYFTRKEWYEQ